MALALYLLVAFKIRSGSRAARVVGTVLAALSVLVTEAGGRFTSLAGEDGPHGGDAIATNGLLHDAALGAIRG